MCLITVCGVRNVSPTIWPPVVDAEGLGPHGAREIDLREDAFVEQEQHAFGLVDADRCCLGRRQFLAQGRHDDAVARLEAASCIGTYSRNR